MGPRNKKDGNTLCTLNKRQTDNQLQGGHETDFILQELLLRY